jgi:hypothetical protein
MKHNNNNKLKTVERLAVLETIATYSKCEIDKLRKGQEEVLAALGEIKEQVSVNKTKLALWGTLGGIIGGGIVTLVVMLLARAF